MIHVQPPPSMSFALVQGVQKKHAIYPHLSPPQDLHWGAAKRKNYSRSLCAHTPPLLSNLDHTGAQFHHGVEASSREARDMNGMNGNPLMNPIIGGHHYSQRVPVVASNAPPYVASRPTLDNSKNAVSQRPFYDSYHSAKRQPSPVQTHKENSDHGGQTSRKRASSDGNTIASHLQIPATINNSKGSLPEFSAQITCLFWFESSYTLHIVEDEGKPPSPIAPLVSEALPTTGFRKWVTTILSMTQVSQNVILLALMFIYRLKRLNPGVKGKIGSEFRLLTVALMLGNKFLDDNTYTNKTWAEVSGISVQEIHVMEVEFLSNMRYTLYASEEEWKAWHVKLGKFSDYYDKASRVQTGLRNLTLPTPQYGLPRDLPSPPVSANSSPPFLNHPVASTAALPHPLSMPPYVASRNQSPTGPIPESEFKLWPRKRSLEDHTSEPSAKRLNSITPSTASSTTLTPSTLTGTPPVPRLPMPNLSIPTVHQQNGYSASPGHQLPTSTGRAMSTIFTASNPRPQTTMQLPSLQPPNYSNQHGNGNRPPPLEFQNRQTPFTSAASTPSPTSYHFPHHTPNGFSPSNGAAPRKSPYKPIRGVNTLLVPPPSASIQNHPQNVSFGQMHYQPLGKPSSERKTGVLPYFPFDTWSQSHHMQHYLPQPNFAS